MSKTVVALDALAALTTLVLRAAQAHQEISALLARAQAEGRDLTDDEVAQIQSRRQDAVARFNRL
jgi:hypothetical protein